MYAKIFLALFLVSACASLGRVKTYAVKCGHLFDSEKAEWKKDQTLLVEGGKIISVNPVSLPSHVDVIDYGAYWVTPGLVDAHTHVFLEDPTDSKDFSLGLLEFMQTHNDGDRKRLGVRRLHSLLKAGFTSVRDLGNQGGVDVRSVKGGARLFSSGPGFSPDEGQLPKGSDKELLRKEYLPLNENLPENFTYDVVKLYADEEPNPTITDPKLLRKWVNWAHARSLKVAGHAILPGGIDSAIEGGVDTLEHGTQVTAVQLKKMKEKNIIFVPTNADYLFLLPQTQKYKWSWTPEITRMTCGNIRKAHALNVTVAFGSDNYFSLEKDGIDFGEGTREILLGYLQCGMQMNDLLKAATFTAATTMGKEKEIGVLKAGAHADFNVYRNDPVHDPSTLRAPVAVYQDGQRK